MNYEATILYAHQQMRQKGFTPDRYHFEPVYVTGTRTEAIAGSIRFTAYNELYILVNQEKYYGLFILGDNTGYNSDNYYQTGVPEFTGIITLTRIAEYWNLYDNSNGLKIIPVEFLRVIMY